MEYIAESISSANYISFSDKEIPSGGKGIPKTLHITVKCKEYAMVKVLVDNGLALNVMPLLTLKRLPIDMSNIQRCNMVVRAFDGTRRDVVGTINIPLQIGPVGFDVTFQVMEINPLYTCLLGHHWIHMAGAVPLSLHQKIKFRVQNSIVTVFGEEDKMVLEASHTPYIEATEKALDCFFRSFKIDQVMSERATVKPVKGLSTQ